MIQYLPMDVSSQYIDLLKKTLINDIYIENEIKLYYLISGLLFGSPVDHRFLVRPQDMKGELPDIIRKSKQTGSIIGMGKNNAPDMPDTRNFTAFPHSMIGRKRMDNIQYCVETVLKENIPGDLIETGVWRGGAVIFMRGILAAHGVKDRNVWVADSFEGVPSPTHEKDDLDISNKTFPVLAVNEEEVRALFERYGLLDDQVKFLKGWFKDSLPGAPIEQLAVLRLDGDLYESTWDALSALYDKVSKGGFVIIDDYHEPNLACKDAVEDFRNERKIKDEMVDIDETAVYWRKGDQ